MNSTSAGVFLVCFVCFATSALVPVAELFPPKPYKFGYTIKDEHGKQYREEASDGLHDVKGSYGFIDDKGIKRLVKYVADKGGFRAEIETNEPGTAPMDAAGVKMFANPIAVDAKDYESSKKDMPLAKFKPIYKSMADVYKESLSAATKDFFKDAILASKMKDADGVKMFANPATIDAKDVESAKKETPIYYKSIDDVYKESLASATKDFFKDVTPAKKTKVKKAEDEKSKKTKMDLLELYKLSFVLPEIFKMYGIEKDLMAETPGLLNYPAPEELLLLSLFSNKKVKDESKKDLLSTIASESTKLDSGGFKFGPMQIKKEFPDFKKEATFKDFLKDLKGITTREF